MRRHDASTLHSTLHQQPQSQSFGKGYEQSVHTPLPAKTVLSHAAAFTATGNTTLLDESSEYLLTHFTKEGKPTDPTYYQPSHDNAAWPAAILLLGQLQQHPEILAAVVMSQHHKMLSHMFRGWLAGQVRVFCCCWPAGSLGGLRGRMFKSRANIAASQ